MTEAQQKAWNFIGQALSDFQQTLPPSAAEAFRVVAGQHYLTLSGVFVDATPAGEMPETTEAEPA